MKGKAFALLMLTVSSMCLAEQKLTVKEGGAVTATISSKGLNRIVVEGDRILTVRGTSGQFQIDKDPTIGQIFLQPSLQAYDDPIYLFITTENGHTYAMSLLINDLAPDSIILLPQQKKTVSAELKSSSPEMIISKLISAMHEQKELPGFRIEQFETNRQIFFSKVILVESYVSDKVVGEHYEVYNNENNILHLDEKIFLRSGVRAIAILNKKILPRSKTQVYIVKTKHG